MKKNLVALAIIALSSGCVVTRSELTNGAVAARFDSPKSPEQLAECVQMQLVPPFSESKNGETYSFLRKSGIVEEALWTIFPTNSGSQAELRIGAKDDGGAEKVRACL